jgi:hypothetical protein
MAFSVIVELLNLRLRRVTQPPVELRHAYSPEGTHESTAANH